MKRTLLFLLGFTVALVLVLFLPAWVALTFLLQGWLGVEENAPEYLKTTPPPPEGVGEGVKPGYMRHAHSRRRARWGRG